MTQDEAQQDLEELVRIPSPKKWTAYVSLVAISLCLFVLVVTLFWLLRPYQVSDVKVPIEILNEDKEIRVGEQIRMRLQVSKPNNIPPNGSVFVECDDGTLVAMVPQVTNLPVGTYVMVNDKYTLPANVPIGEKCRFHFNNAYQVNPIRTITKDWYSETFLTLEAKPDGASNS